MWRRQDDKPAPHPEERGPASTATTADVSPPRTPPARSATTLLSPGTTVRGEIFGNEDLYLDGVVRGTVRLDGAQVTIGPRGRIYADVEADQIVVQGQVEGHLRARRRVEVGSAGVVRGDIYAARLHVQEGAVVCGQVKLEGGERLDSSAHPLPSPEPVRAAESAHPREGSEPKDRVH
ncbi:MAG: polymer-forming cytoskeletal protein [Firmicutes bacterium]|nr:polymer-forming cytoskeletal protein [Bacillota bacterium]